MSFHIGPFGRENAVHHAVAHRPVSSRPVMADDSILFGTQGLNCSLRRKIEIVGAQADDLAAQRVERVTKQQQLARRVDVAALPSFSIPGVTDLHAIDVRYDVVITRATDDHAGCQLADRPRQHMPVPLARKRLGNVCARLLRFRNRGEP